MHAHRRDRDQLVLTLGLADTLLQITFRNTGLFRKLLHNFFYLQYFSKNLLPNKFTRIGHITFTQIFERSQRNAECTVTSMRTYSSPMRLRVLMAVLLAH